MIRKSKTEKRKKIIILLISVLAVFAVILFVWWKTHQTQPAAPSVAQSDSTKIDLSPATEEDKADSNSHKTTDTTTTPTTAGQKLAVTPVIVDANQYDQQVEVRSYVTGVVESDGTCTFTFSKGSTSFQRQNTALADATTTKCPNITLDSTAFTAKGTWSVVVSYDSVKATGASSPVNFEVK